MYYNQLNKLKIKKQHENPHQKLSTSRAHWLDMVAAPAVAI
jgi:hypothetical protein